MALGVEHHWAQAFDGIVKDPPSWYVSPNGYVGFSPLFFSSSMHSMASDMHQVFTSAPRVEFQRLRLRRRRILWRWILRRRIRRGRRRRVLVL